MMFQPEVIVLVQQIIIRISWEQRPEAIVSLKIQDFESLTHDDIIITHDPFSQTNSGSGLCHFNEMK